LGTFALLPKDFFQKRNTPSATGACSSALGQLTSHPGAFTPAPINQLAPGNMKTIANRVIQIHGVSSSSTYSTTRRECPRPENILRALHLLLPEVVRVPSRRRQRFLHDWRDCLFRLLYRLTASRLGLLAESAVYQELLTLAPTADPVAVTAELLTEVARLETLPPEELGACLPALLNLNLRLDRKSWRIVASGKKSCKQVGSYYTPPELVERLLDSCWQTMRLTARAEVRLADLSCGVGHFLLAAARRLFANGQRPTQLLLGLVGYDIHPLAVELTGMGLALVARVPLDHAPVRVRQANSLFDALPEAEQADIIVGNPPWVSLTGRQRPALPAGLRQRLLKRYPTLRRWPALHSAFLLRAVELVRPGGCVGLVLPRPVAELTAYAELRRQVSSLAELGGPVVDVGETVFPGVTHPVGLFVLIKRDRPAAGTAAAWPVDGDRPAPRRRDRLAPLWQALSRLPRFPPGTFSDPGVHTGNAAAALVVKFPEAAGVSPLRVGRDVRPFACASPSLWLRINVKPNEKMYFAIRPWQRYASVPIVVRQTANRPIAARHEPPAYFRNSVLACAGVTGLPHSVVVGVLNSALLAGYYRRLTVDARQRAFPQVKVKHLQNLPLPVALHRDGKLLIELDELVQYAEKLAQADASLPASVTVRLERLVLRAYDLPAVFAEELLAAVCD
jgi:hypothetical protein